MARPFPAACERAREQISHQLDGELSSELECASLQAHLTRCPSCRAVGAELEGLTHALRVAPQELPAFTVISMPQRRYVGLRTMQAAAAAAAVALVAGLGSLGLTNSLSHESASPYAHLSPHASFRGDELVPGHLRKPRGRSRNRIAL